MPRADLPSNDTVVAETLAWLDRAVIGLNLCPFARAVRVKGQIRCIASDATDVETLLHTLCEPSSGQDDDKPVQLLPPSRAERDVEEAIRVGRRIKVDGYGVPVRQAG